MGMALLRSCRGASPCSAETVPPLARAMAIRNHRNGSGMDSHVRCLWELFPVAGTLWHPMGWNYHNHPGPHSLSPCTAGEEEVEPGKEGGVGKRCFFKDVLYFSLFCSLLIASSLLSQVQSALSVMIFHEWSLSVLISTHKLSLYFLCPVHLQRKLSSSCGYLVSSQGQRTLVTLYALL